MNLARRTLGGVFWAYASYFAGRILTLVSTTILARILAPKDFGLIAFSLLLFSFIDATRSFGINDALIYNSERVEDTANTAFALNVAIGIVQFLAAFALAPFARGLFDDARIVDVVRVMALIFLIDSLGRTHDALLQKELKFKRRFLPDLLSTVIRGTASIVFALAGMGVWSLVIGSLVGTAAQTIAKWWALGWIPQLQFYADRARSLWDYGFHILAFQMISIALDQADQLLIGTLLGATQLGYYAIAARIPEMVIANFSLVLTKVLFPTYAKLKDDRARLTSSFLLTTKFTAFATVPAGFGMAAVAPELILVFAGDQWEPAIPLLRVLAFLGMVATLPWAAGDVFKAIGRPDISTKLLIVESLYTFPLIYGLTVQSRVAVMASFANLLALCITTLVRLGYASRFLNIHPMQFFHTFRSPFIGAAIMFGAVTGWRYLLDGLPIIVILATSLVIGGLVYLPILWLLEKEQLLAAKDFLKAARRGDDDDDEDEPVGDAIPTPVPSSPPVA